jgi:hypothetical protein
VPLPPGKFVVDEIGPIQPNRVMQQWIFLKESIIGWVGLDRQAINLLASFLCCLLAAWVSRRPLAHPLPWLVALAIGAANEAAVAFGDGRLAAAEAMASLGDLALFMLLPTALLLVGRYQPQLIATRPDRRILVPAVWEKKAPVVEAVFREGPAEAPPQASRGRG